MKFIFTLALPTVLLAFAQTAAAQETYRHERATFDITSSVGLADKPNRDYFGTSFTAGLRKEFPLDKMISLHATADYQTLSGKNHAPSLKLVNLGGGITFYPNSFAALLLKRNYDDEAAEKDSFYLDGNFSWNVNSNAYGKPGDMATINLMINVKRFRLNDRLAISPKIGSQTVFFKQDIFDRSSFNYFTVGVGLNFGNFKY